MTTDAHIEGKRIMVLKATGSFVYKVDIRELLQVNSYRHWKEELDLIKKEVEEFEAKYKPYNRSNKVRVEVARIIVLHILEKTQENIELQISWE